MNIKKTIFCGMMGMTTLLPCKAQRAVQFVSETGITGVVNKEASFYSGINMETLAGRNYSDLFAGVSVNPEKKPSFIALAINNFPWTKNLSTWVRETFVAGNKTSNSTLEAAPVRANASLGKFSFSLAPSYTLRNDFREGTTTQGINTVFQTLYTATPTDKIILEAKYTSEPSKSLFNTHFGSLKNNVSYFIAYLKNL